MAKVQTIDVNSMTKDVEIKAKSKNTILYLKGISSIDNLLTGSDTKNDLTITFTNGYKITLKDYFAKNGRFPVKTIKTDSNSYDLISFVNDNGIKGASQNVLVSLVRSITTSVFDDTIQIFRENGATVNANKGNDTIYSGEGNDTLIGGLGTNEIKYEYVKNPDDYNPQETYGSDIIKLTKGETLKINITYKNDAESKPALTFERGTGKGANDLIIKNDANPDDKITIQNYYGKETGAKVLINGVDYTTTIIDELALNDTHVVKAKLNGSALADDIDVSNADPTKTTYDKKTKTTIYTGVTINAGAGDDTITGSAYNDTIIGGKGVNTLNIDVTQKFGNDIYKLTSGEKLNIVTNGDVEYTKDSKGNVVITADDNGSLTIQGLAKNDITQGVTINGEALVFDFDEGNISKNKITGTAQNDEIDIKDKYLEITTGKGKNRVTREKLSTEAGITINSGSGDDTITGTKYSDTITGGTGKNTIKILNETFGNDTINLTKGEQLILDMSAYTSISSADALKGSVKVSGNNLLITTNNGTITLKNFAKSNVVNDGYVKVKLNGGAFVDLNVDEVLSYQDDFSKNDKKKTATFTGSRFDETVSVTGALDEYTKTVNTGNGKNTVNITNAMGETTVNGGSGVDIVNITNSGKVNAKLGNGENVANISGSGINTIISGVDDDTINVSENTTNTIIKAGAGENTININSDNFGTVVLAEEKVGAKNIINFQNGVSHDYTFTKSGNTLIISNAATNSALTIQDYFSVSTNKVKYAEKEFIMYGQKNSEFNWDLGALVSLSGSDLQVVGSGTIQGTEYNNTILGGAGNDKIYTGSGRSTINGGAGNDHIYVQNNNFNTIIFDANCGNDVVHHKDGAFYKLKFTELSTDEDLYNALSMDKSGNNLIINYGNNKITLENYFLNYNSMYYNLVGTNGDDLSIDTFIQNKPMPLRSTKKNETITGHKNTNEVIYATSGSNTVYAQSGDDTIYTGSGYNNVYAGEGNDKIYGGAGNDYIEGGIGNDTINAGNGTNSLCFYAGDGSDVIENGGGTDTLCIYAEINKIYQNENDLIIRYGEGDDITVKDYYVNPSKHSVKKIYSQDENRTISIAQAIQKYSSGTIDNTDTLKASKGGDSVNVILGEGNSVSGTTNGTNYIYADNVNSTINAGTGYTNYIKGGSGDDVINLSTGVDYVDGGSGHNIINVNKGGGSDYMEPADSGKDNTIVFKTVTFSVDNSGKVTDLGDLQIRNGLNNAYKNHIQIKGYGSDSDIVTFLWYYQTGDGYLEDYSGYQLKDSQGHVISLADAVELHKKYLSFEGIKGGDDAPQTIYTPSTEEHYLSNVETANGISEGGNADDTIYAGGIYQEETGIDRRPSISGGDGNDTIHAEGNTLYFTTDRDDLIYTSDFERQFDSSSDTKTTVYNTDHVYITPADSNGKHKVVTGYFFFVYKTEVNDYGQTTRVSYQLDDFDKGEYYGTYNFSYYEGLTQKTMEVHVYHVDDLLDAKIEGKKSYLFDYGDKVSTGRLSVDVDAGDDTIYIGNGNTAYGGAGVDVIRGDGLADGGEGNDKIYMSDDNYYYDGLGNTSYEIDGGDGNDYIDISDITNRAKDKDVIDFSSGEVVYGADDEVNIYLKNEGVDTVVIDPTSDKPICINLEMYKNRNMWYGTRYGNTDAAFGTFRRGDDLYIAANNTSNKVGIIVIKDYYAKDEHGNDIFTPERKASINVYFEPSIRDNDSSSKYPKTYITLEEFIQHYNEFATAEVNAETGVKNYDYYDYSFQWGKGVNTTRETNSYYTFIDNQGAHVSVINPDGDTPDITVEKVEYYHPDISSDYLATRIVKENQDSGYFIIGGDGDQTINGGRGDDVIYGDNLGSHDSNGDWVEDHSQDGADKIYAGAGDDYVVAGDGNDFIDAGTGADRVYGGDGNDTIIAGASETDGTWTQDSYVYGEGGDDTIYSRAVLNKGTLNEIESQKYLGGDVANGVNHLYGGDGNDTIYANGYSDTVEAGSGNDKVYLYTKHSNWQDGSTVDVSLGEGNDELYAYGEGQVNIHADAGNNEIDLRGLTSDYNNIYSGTGSDTIWGGSGKDSIYSTDGDYIDAGAGDDRIEGGGVIKGGIGNDTIIATGRAEVYGDEDNDTIYLGNGTNTNPSAITANGGLGDDVYVSQSTNGFDTLIANEGKDVIKILNVTPDNLSMYRKGNDVVLSRKSDNTDIGSLLILKDYYSNAAKYGENANKTAKELFDNWTVETYTGDLDSAKRMSFTLVDFLAYAGGNTNNHTNGQGTSGDDIVEASQNIRTIDGKAGDDNIIAANGTETINGGSGSDNIIGSEGCRYKGDYNYYDPYIQKIFGDNGSATFEESLYRDKETGTVYNSNGYFDITYTPSDNNQNDGDDNIISYASHAYIWGEGGNDTIRVENGWARIWGGDGDDNISALNTYEARGIRVYGGDGKDTIDIRAPYIDGGDGDDTIVHTFNGYSDCYQENRAALIKEYGIPADIQDTIDALSIKSGEVKTKFDYYAKSLSNAELYERYIKILNGEIEGTMPTYGDVAYWQRKLDDANANIYGSSYSYEKYYNSLSEEEKVNAKYSRQYATYANDLNTIRLYNEYIENYNNSAYKGITFREEGNKAYWQWRLESANARMYGGFEGTEGKYNRIKFYVDNYDELTSHDKAYFDQKLAEAQEHYRNYGNYDMTYEEAQAELDNAQLFVDYYSDEIAMHDKSYWQSAQNTAYDEYSYDLALVTKYKEYNDNYFDDDFTGADYVCTNGHGFESFRQEGEYYSAQSPNTWETGRSYWGEKWTEAETHLKGVREGNALIDYKDDPNIASSTRTEYQNQFSRLKKDASTYSYYVDNWYLYEDETYVAPYGTDYTSFRQEGNAEYWYRKYEAKCFELYNSDQTGIGDRWNSINYLKESGVSLTDEQEALWAATKVEYETAIALREAYYKRCAYYEYDDGVTFRDESVDTYENRVETRTISLYGNKGDYEYHYSQLLKDANALRASLPSEIAEKVFAHIYQDIIIGGNGDDEITIGCVPEGSKSQGCKAFVLGGEGDDIYTVDGRGVENYSDEKVAPNITIDDTQGTNTVYFNNELLSSGNIGLWANVVLKKDDNGKYIKKADGNYEYVLQNFGKGVDESGVETILDAGAFYDGDLGYSVILTDMTTYSSTYYTGEAEGDPGIRFSEDTLNHIDKIYASDGKYVTKAQIDDAIQNAANWLAEHGYDSYLSCNNGTLLRGTSDTDLNQVNITSYKGFGILDWITPGDTDIVAKTEGTEGSNVADNLTSTSENETFNLKYGFDTVTFTGEFGDDVINSSSTKDSKGNARQIDILNMEEYSVSDKTIKFTQDGDDLVITAYDNEGNVAGTVTYKGFLGDEYTSRYFVLNAKDHEYMVSKMDINADNYDIDDDKNYYYNIRFFRSTDAKRVDVAANTNRSYYYTVGDTPIRFSTYNGEPDEVFSLGQTTDTYSDLINANTNIVIHDEGGDDDVIAMRYGGWDNTKRVKASHVRLFFDVDKDGNVSDCKHFVRADKFITYQYGVVKGYDVENYTKLINESLDHPDGAITFYGDIEWATTDDHYNLSDDVWTDATNNISISIPAYIRGILKDIVDYLNENHFNSVKDVLNNGTDEQKKDILALYNFDYDYARYRNMYGTEGDDVITTYSSYDTRTIEGMQGNDTINLPITANSHSVQIIYDFERGDGHDTVVNTYRNLSNDVEDTIVVNRGDSPMYTKFRADEWDLKIEFYSDASATEDPQGSITVTDYFKNETKNRIDKLIIKSDGNADEICSIEEMLENQGVINTDVNVIIGTSGADTFNGTNNNDAVYTNGGENMFDKADIINSSAGNDTYYLTNEYAKYTYTVGHGDDVIYNTNFRTGLTFDMLDKDVSMEYRQIGNDLKVLFFTGDGASAHKEGSVLIKNYFDKPYIYDRIANNGSTDTSFIKQGDTLTPFKMETLITDYVNKGGSLVDNDDVNYLNIIRITNETATGLVLNNSGKIDTLVFEDVNDFNELSYSFNNNDLMITHNGKTVTVKNYKNGNSSLADIRVNGVLMSVDDARGGLEYFGTNGDDYYAMAREDGQTVTYNLNKGNDTVEFTQISAKQDVHKKVVINSASEKDSDGKPVNTDIIRMTQFDADEVRFGYADNGGISIIAEDKEAASQYNKINYPGYYYERKAEVTYNNYLTGDTPDLVVSTDYNDINVYRYNGTQNINDDNNTSENRAVYIQASSGTSTVTGGSGYSTYLTNGGADLVYTSNFGNKNTVVTQSVNSDDTYNLTSNSSYLPSVKIIDNGGDDTLNLYNMKYKYSDGSYENHLEKTFLLFDVKKVVDGDIIRYTTDDKFYLEYYSSGRPNLSVSVLSGGNYLFNNNGVIEIEAAKSNGMNIGIENVNVYETKKGVNADYSTYSYSEAFGCIDMERWYAEIKSEVQNWFNSHTEYSSVAEVFAKGGNDEQDLISVFAQKSANDYLIPKL